MEGWEEGQESKRRERVERGYGPKPRPGQAQSTRCKNANRPPPTQYFTKQEGEITRECNGGRLLRNTF